MKKSLKISEEFKVLISIKLHLQLSLAHTVALTRGVYKTRAMRRLRSEDFFSQKAVSLPTTIIDINRTRRRGAQFHEFKLNNKPLLM